MLRLDGGGDFGVGCDGRHGEGAVGMLARGKGDRVVSDQGMDPDLPHRVLAACLEVHRHLGPGLSRGAYEECLAIELRQLEMPFERAKPLTFAYRGQTVQDAATLDFVVEDDLLVRVLAVEEISEGELARTESLLRLAGLRTGLLVNFNVSVLRKGVHRVNLKRRGGGAADGDV